MSKQSLLRPINIGDLKLKNRVIMAPMTRNRADNEYNASTDLHTKYYQQRASAGFIIREGSQISYEARG